MAQLISPLWSLWCLPAERRQPNGIQLGPSNGPETKQNSLHFSGSSSRKHLEENDPLMLLIVAPNLETSKSSLEKKRI